MPASTVNVYAVPPFCDEAESCGTTGTFGMMLGIFLEAGGHIAREAGGSR
jgi:hypothetical protein